MNEINQEDTHRIIERVARESYGRLVAYLSANTRDVASAEDALSNALVAALTAWPRDGVPQSPEAWLLTAARRSFIDLVRHRQVAEASEPTLHGKASLLQNAGQFPTTLIHSFPIDTEASRYYKSGRSFAYRYLPFWLASLLTRALVVLVPIFVIVIPSLRYLPQLYNWRIRSRIHRRYGELMAIEREALLAMSPERRAALLDRVDEIERSVIAVKMPGSHGETLYRLRELLRFVRDRLSQVPVNGEPPPPAEEPEEAED